MGDGSLGRPDITHKEGVAMRIYVQRRTQGELEVVVVPAPRSHLPPVTIRGTDKDVVMVEVGATIEGIRAYKPDAPAALEF